MQDDRGQRVTIHRDEKTLRGMKRREYKKMPSTIRIVNVALCILMFASQATIFTYIYLGMPAAYRWVMFVGCTMAVISSFTMVFFSIVADKTCVWNIASSMTRCPACLFELEYLPVESDGCTVCPECAAAWRLSEISGA